MDLSKVKAAAGSPLVTIIAVAAAFYAGWHLRPPEVKVVETVKSTETRHEIETSHAGLTIDDVRKAFAEFSKSFNVSRSKKTVRLPDGTVTTEEHTDDKSVVNSKSSTEDTSKSNLTLDVKKTADVSKTEERRIEIVPQLRAPDWEFGLGAGLNVPSLWGSTPQTYVPLPGWLDVRGSVSRQILGPAGLRLEVNTRLQIGLWFTVRL